MSLGKIITKAINDNKVIIQTDKGLIFVYFIANDIIRIKFNKGEILKEEETFIVDSMPDLKKVNINIIENENEILLRSDSLSVIIETDHLMVKVKSLEGKLIFSTFDDMGEMEDKKSILRINLNVDEKIYGLGQDPMGSLNQRDKERRMWQQWSGLRRSGNIGIPFYMSSSGYGVLLNSSYASIFANGYSEVAETFERGNKMAPAPWPWDIPSEESNPDNIAIIVENDVMDVFVICRENYDELLNGYVDLTGHSPMLPKWALGYIQCKNRYRTEDELIAIGKKFRNKKIPCDVLVIDWLWFKEFGDLEWDIDNWGNVETILKQLREMGFSIIQAQHPFVEKTSLKYEEFLQKGYLNITKENDRPTYDHSNPLARIAWWNEIKKLHSTGITGYWTDMGELEEHPIGTLSYLGSRERIHNIYSLLWAKGLFEGQRKDFNDRVFSLQRSAYAGIQRYSTALWSGDINSSWETLREQVVVGQGVCLSGQQYWTTDIGGFCPHKDFSSELFIRWFEWGTFCPIFRTHGTRAGNEPWSFGENVEKIITKYINLRYKLMPYIYSCSRKVTENGRPIMRAMCMDYKDDEIAINQCTQYMFGPSILVAPVTDEGYRERKVYLPIGKWYDFWTDEMFEGNRWVSIQANLDTIPLFIKAGSIIPMCKILQHADSNLPEEIEIHSYKGESGRFELYEDDGISYNYEKGSYLKTYINSDKDGEIEINHIEGEEYLISKGRNYIHIIHDNQVIGKDDLEVTVDTNLKNNGICMVKINLKSNINEIIDLVDIEIIVKGWSVELAKNKLHIDPYSFISIQASMVIQADILPLINTGTIYFKYKRADLIYDKIEEFKWGNYFATRWSIVDDISASENYDLNCNLNLPYFKTEKEIHYYKRYYDNEFNPFGYVQFPIPAPENGYYIGFAFAKCSVWTENDIDVFAEVAAESKLTLWINKTKIYYSDNIVFQKVIENDIFLHKGFNDVLIKVEICSKNPCSGREFGFNFRFVDKRGNIIEDLLYRPH